MELRKASAGRSMRVHAHRRRRPSRSPRSSPSTTTSATSPWKMERPRTTAVRREGGGRAQGRRAPRREDPRASAPPCGQLESKPIASAASGPGFLDIENGNASSCATAATFRCTSPAGAPEVPGGGLLPGLHRRHRVVIGPTTRHVRALPRPGGGEQGAASKQVEHRLGRAAPTRCCACCRR